MTDQRQQRAARDFLTGPVNRRDAPGGLSEPVLSAALCRSMQAHLAAPRYRVSRDTNAPIPSRPSRARRERQGRLEAGSVARDQHVALATQTAPRPQATNVRVI